MRERLYRTEAVILRRSDFGEADRLLTIYTPELGKRRVVARGIRKTTSKLAGHLELFSYTTLMLARGRNLDVITQSHVLQGYQTLRVEPQRLFRAYYAVEVLDRLIEEDDPNSSVFDLLIHVLAGLDQSRNPDLMLRFYELHLLNYLGYRPHLYRCAACQELLTEQAGHFAAAAGGVLCPRCARADQTALPMTLRSFKLLRFLQSQPLEEVERLALSTEVCLQIEQLLRAYLRYTLERDLRSVVFLDAIRQQSGKQGVQDGLY